MNRDDAVTAVAEALRNAPKREGEAAYYPTLAEAAVAALEPYIAARIAAETEATRLDAAALRTSVAWHERMGPINAMAAARLAKTVALSAPGLVDTSTQEYRTALADAVRGIQQQARAEAEAERDEARQIARDMIDQRDEARAALARVEALSHDEGLIRAFAIDRYEGSPEDQADAVADLIARVLAGGTP